MIFEKVSRDEFLKRRAQQSTEALIYSRTHPEENIIVIPMDEDDDVVCDVCNATVEDSELFITDWGLYCNECKTRNEREG